MGARPAFGDHLDGTPVGEHEFPRDCQTQAAALDPPQMTELALIEPIEYTLAIFGRDARTGIANLDGNEIGRASCRERV